MLQRILMVFIMLFSVSAHAATPNSIDINHLFLTLLEFFGLGVLLAFTPCVFPMVPILSGIIIGEKNLTTAKALKLSLTFVLSMAVTYAILGIIAGYLGHTIQGALQSPLIITAFSIIFILMALSMFGLFDLNMPPSIQNYISKVSNNKKSGTLVGVATMGVLSTLIASPCVTAPLISVLTYISNTGSPLIGGSILFVLAMGMGLPLLLFGVGQGALLPKTGPWMNKVKVLFGLMMLGLAIWMMSRILPDFTTRILWTTLLAASVFLLIKWTQGCSNRKKYIAQTILVLTIIGGGITIFSNPITTTSPAIKNFFTVVTTKTMLQNAINKAKQEGRPIIIDFYATWCPDCQLLDKTFFADAKVQKILKPFFAIRVDVGQKNDLEIKEIRNDYKVYGTPTVIFENQNEEEIFRGNNAIGLDELEKITSTATSSK